MNNPRMGVRYLAALLLVVLTGRSLADELLKDINTVPVPASSNPRYLGAAGSTVLFVAGSGTASAELGLWATDGTVTGTRKLLSNDTSSGFFHPQSLLTLGSRVLWSGPGPGGVIDLWASDGTAAGTLKIGQLDGNPIGVLGVIPGGVDDNGAESAAGTVTVTVNAPAASPSPPSNGPSGGGGGGGVLELLTLLSLGGVVIIRARSGRFRAPASVIFGASPRHPT